MTEFFKSVDDLITVLLWRLNQELCNVRYVLCIHGRDKKYIKKFSWKSWRGNVIWESKRRRKKNIRMSLKEGGYKVLNLIKLGVVNRCLQRKDPSDFIEMTNFLSSGRATTFARRNLLRGLSLLVIVTFWAFNRALHYFDIRRGWLCTLFTGKESNYNI
jgi:hypothetical protein